MAIDAVNAPVPQPAAEALGTTAPGARPAAGHGFGDALREAVGDLDGLSLEAQSKVSSLVSGGGGEVHDAMIAVEKADLSFQLMLQVRNKMVQAYQQIANMQF